MQNVLVFVNTLDGKVTALDTAHEGKKTWTLDLGKTPMLSSNIHQRELNNRGQWVRLIPSLNGGLYKFDGENLEAVPLSTEQLLKSSFRYSDLVFSGSLETRTYGVSVSTGKVLYECNQHDCKNTTEGESYVEPEVLVIQRYQQTVRAAESRSGYERWNFSVGHHGLSLTPNENLDCHYKKTQISLDIDIKVIVPEGIIWAVDRNNPTSKLWEYKFDSPIMSVWKEDSNYEANGNSAVKEINLFEISQRLWHPEFAFSPGLYLGMHNQQLYVQENPTLKSLLEPSISLKDNVPKFPWKPYPAIAFSGNDKLELDVDNSLESKDDVQSTALSVLYSSNYINGNGFYLYSKEQLIINSESQCKKTTIPEITNVSAEEESLIDEFEEQEEEILRPMIVSLWFWWKEVVLISITTAILLNFMITQSLLNANSAVKDAILPPCIIETHIEKKEEIPNASLDTTGSKFTSRFLEDYDPIGCLGRGGYGFVFEARNKLDRRIYAIKRITLPSSLKSRERVLREVRALAQLEHDHVVRYFGAWVECPPAGWQQEKDRELLNKEKFPNCDFLSSLSASDIKSSNSVHISVPPSEQSSLDSACEAYELNNKDDDSFIVFEAYESDVVKESQEFTQDYNETNEHVSESTESVGVIEETKSSEIDSIDKDKLDSISASVVFQLSGRKNTSEERKKRKASLSLNLQDKGSNMESSTNSAEMFLYIQMQLCKKMSLSEWLKEENKTRDIKLVLNTFQQIVNAVQYVHLQGLIHRDLKPSNIFISFDKKVKIGDFGLVAMTEGYNEVHTPGDSFDSFSEEGDQHTARVGTRLYMSPEQLNGERYNFKVDIYSLGIILAELLIPFETYMERVDTLTKIRHFKFPKYFELHYPTEFSLVKMMLDVDPSKRPTTAGITARMRFVDQKTLEEVNSGEMANCHFEWSDSQLRRHSSVTNSSSSSNSVSWELN
ncbi:eukaryotic translation initiation factor 2-alpha kinase isoform X2 [Belonocnema kinseyi]|uniref:eukaryotic translation initiation factor 2-alpha kinase isoform X2 n=1 Tax=Belonocnema kinseyi TaxID=2817044 RepID=UPI00143D8BCC|nr:eukaryotic translation initiation factor 2-alpha kinase isoform X2 [Belonocnema kinseyi]